MSFDITAIKDTDEKSQFFSVTALFLLPLIIMEATPLEFHQFFAVRKLVFRLLATGDSSLLVILVILYVGPL